MMREALSLAALGDMPFGAVIVKDDVIIARANNQGKSLKDPTAHGEMLAIRKALAEHGPEALKGATLYTTGEPCVMCMGAIMWCGFGRLVFGASIAELATRIGQIEITCDAVAARTGFHAITIEGGLLAQAALALFD